MVSDVTITPQSAGRSGTREVPTIRVGDVQSRSIRNVPSVNPTGFRKAQQAYSFVGQEAAQAVDQIQSYTEQYRRKVQITQEQEDAAVFADIKSKAIRRADEIKRNNPLSVNGFDGGYEAYAAEVLKDVPDRLRPSLEVELYSIGTTKRGQISSRLEQQSVSNYRFSQEVAFEDAMDEIINSIQSEQDYPSARLRGEQLINQVDQSFVDASQKRVMRDRLQSDMRMAALKTTVEGLHEQGLYHEIIPQVAQVLEGEMGQGLNQLEVIDEAREALKLVEAQETIRKNAESRFEKAQKEIRENNMEAVVSQLGRAIAGEDEMPSVTEINKMDLDASDRLSALRIATGKDGIDDRRELQAIRNEGLVSPGAALERLQNANIEGRVTTSTYLSEDARLRSQLQNNGIAAPEQKALSSLDAVVSDSMLNNYPMIGYTIEQAKSDLTQRIQEYDASDQSGNQTARANFIKEESRKIISEYLPVQLKEMVTTFKMPYGVEKSNRTQIDLDDINTAKIRLIEDEEAGVIPSSRVDREFKEISRWSEYLKMQQEVEDARNNR